MARNKKNLKMQMLEKLDSLNRIGTKKGKEGGGSRDGQQRGARDSTYHFGYRERCSGYMIKHFGDFF